MYDPVHRFDDFHSTQAELALVEAPVAVEPGPMERIGWAIVTLSGFAVWALILNALWRTLANL